MFRSLYSNPYLWNMLFGNVKKGLTPLQKLKRDTDFKYKKKTDSYNYKGKTIKAKEAIKFVEENGLRELKNKLLNEDDNNEST